jgi:hypothetical protein
MQSNAPAKAERLVYLVNLAGAKCEFLRNRNLPGDALEASCITAWMTEASQYLGTVLGECAIDTSDGAVDEPM